MFTRGYLQVGPSELQQSNELQRIQLLVKAAPKNQEENLETIPDLHPSPPGPCIAACIALMNESFSVSCNGFNQ